jgi:hypothetical protein
MQVANAAGTNVFGLYELSDNGTVLYSRTLSEDGSEEPASEVVGRDFFYDVARFQNTDDLRRHFRRFIKGDRSVDAFVFDCLFDSEVVHAKIFMALACETDYPGKIVIMDIRRAWQ